MIAKIKWITLLLWIFCLTDQLALSQPYSSKNNYTGDWETPESWDPTWAVPQINILGGYDITINGYITVNSSLSFSGLASNLIINDTLVIIGNLSLDNNNDLTINDNGILIVRGNLTIGNQTLITANGYFIITGNLIKVSSILQGSFTSNDNPVRVFIGGTISSVGLTDNNPSYPAINCISPATTPYPNSTCSYGDMTDIITDPIYLFFQSTCIIATPTITAGGPTTFCAGGSVTLTSSAGSTYLWSTGATTASINVTTSGSYTVRVTNASGCINTATTTVTANDKPIAIAGPDQKLKFTFETVMKAELSSSETGEWSLVSGSGKISDIYSPTTTITELSVGENVFLWKVMSGNCEASAEVKITVYDLFIPSVITPNNDGKNDFFQISEIIDKVELIVFNQWGIEEYSNDNYVNDWDGRNNKGDELPNDTYFYVLRFENGKIKQGSVLIKR